jgi:hypothetical protein
MPRPAHQYSGEQPCAPIEGTPCADDFAVPDDQLGGAVTSPVANRLAVSPRADRVVGGDISPGYAGGHSTLRITLAGLHHCDDVDWEVT